MNDDLIMSNTPDTDYSQALAEGWLPIREVSRITGVNAVTLRAWERRYGLIVPHRTAKGHRLFFDRTHPAHPAHFVVAQSWCLGQPDQAAA